MSEALAEVLEDWTEDPSAFAHDNLRVGRNGPPLRLWESHDGSDSQADIARAVPTNRRITVRSGHKTGKSCLAAVIALWFYVCLNARVILTAPTYKQIDDVVWRDIDRFYRSARMPLGGRIYDSPFKGIQHPNGAQIIGRTADDPESFSGISWPTVVYLVDEASGVDPKIFEAIAGNRAGGAWLILFSNPTQPVGEFFDSHHEKASLYRTFHIRSQYVAEHINPHGEIPGLATPEWVKEMGQEWGVGSPVHDVRVEGNFAAKGAANVLALTDVKNAMDIWTPQPPRDVIRMPLKVGVDVARFGDDSNVAFGKRGRYAYQPMVLQDGDGPMVAQAVASYTRSLMNVAEGRRPGSPKPEVNVESIGVGASAYDSLARIKWLTAHEVNVAEKADQYDDYANLRSQLYFQLGAWIEAGGMIPPDPQLRAELLAPRYGFDRRRRLQVELKKLIKARLGRSPDKADALTMCAYEGGGRTYAHGFRLKGL